MFDSTRRKCIAVQEKRLKVLSFSPSLIVLHAWLLVLSEPGAPRRKCVYEGIVGVVPIGIAAIVQVPIHIYLGVSSLGLGWRDPSPDSSSDRVSKMLCTHMVGWEIC